MVMGRGAETSPLVLLFVPSSRSYKTTKHEDIHGEIFSIKSTIYLVRSLPDGKFRLSLHKMSSIHDKPVSQCKKLPN